LTNSAKRLLRNPWLELAARLILGATFIYASYHKIIAPADFAKSIYGYDLFPPGTINLIAIVVPFVELITGTALIIGFYPQSAALVINAMLVFFILIISTNLIRGHEFDCGCFSVQPDRIDDSPSFMLGRNLLLLSMGIYSMWYGLERTRLFVLTKQ
jgi:uncharacterized membrane protein YphA (DoxX/SURF4 family)